MSESRRPRLDTPRDTRRQIVRRPAVDADAFGVFAESFARYMGTAKFILWMTLFVIVWVAWNALAPEHLRFDEPPFIALTLMLSLQASYAAPLILLAQNRQEQRDKVVGEQAVPEWDNEEAATIFQQLYTAADGKVDGVLAANDGLGGAAISILEGAGQDGKVPVTGQDATVEGLQNVLAGTQCMTVYKSATQEAGALADVAIALANGEEADVTGSGSSRSVTTSARPWESSATRSASSSPAPPSTLVVRPRGTASAAPYIFWFAAAWRRPRPSRPSSARPRLRGVKTRRPSRNRPRRGCTVTWPIASQGRPRHSSPRRIRTPRSSATSSGVRESTSEER